jgi:hypothetical protein
VGVRVPPPALRPQPPPLVTIRIHGAVAQLAKAPVSKTGDSRFESWLPRCSHSAWQLVIPLSERDRGVLIDDGGWVNGSQLKSAKGFDLPLSFPRGGFRVLQKTDLPEDLPHNSPDPPRVAMARAHNPKIAGSNPPPAMKRKAPQLGPFLLWEWAKRSAVCVPIADHFCRRADEWELRSRRFGHAGCSSSAFGWGPYRGKRSGRSMGTLVVGATTRRSGPIPGVGGAARPNVAAFQASVTRDREG